MSTNIEDPRYRKPFETRIRRAESWLECAKREHDSGDLASGHWDVAFVLYWIAFNAAIAHDESEQPNTQKEFDRCVKRILQEDGNCDIRREMERVADSIRKILNNEYLYKRYWHFVNERPGNANWRQRFEDQLANLRSTGRRSPALSAKTILSTLFRRLCTLRNQIVHGGATWKSDYNRSSLKHGLPIMAALVPAFIRIIRQNPGVDWGRPYYRPGLHGKTRPE